MLTRDRVGCSAAFILAIAAVFNGPAFPLTNPTAPSVCQSEIARVQARIQHSSHQVEAAIARFHLRNAQREASKLDDTACIRELSKAMTALRPRLPTARLGIGAATTEQPPIQASLPAEWSMRDALLGASLYSDDNRKVGVIEDVLFSLAEQRLHVVVRKTGILGLGTRRQTIPLTQLYSQSGRFYLASPAPESGTTPRVTAD